MLLSNTCVFNNYTTHYYALLKYYTLYICVYVCVGLVKIAHIPLLYAERICSQSKRIIMLSHTSYELEILLYK